jgi:anti-sigma28 factor (negative regulator of flagellin synthesis)
MSEIGTIGGGASAAGLPRPLREGETRPGDRAETRSAPRGADRVEVSSLARELARAQEPVRQELIDRVRAEIEAGTYESPEKLDAAVRKLLGELGPES